MMKRLPLLYAFVLLLPFISVAQVKILFDATKAETAANADWTIDADAFNLGFPGGNPSTTSGGNEANPQRLPTPLQNTITSTTAETYWQGSLSSWGIALVKLGYEVETLPYNGKITYGDNTNAQDLSNYKVFIVDEPNILFTTAEKTALLNFVQNGGGLFMISDHAGSDRNNDGHDSPSIWNDFMTSSNNVFGITWAVNDFSQTSTNFANLPGDSIIHGPAGTPVKLQYSGGSSLKINPALNSSVTGIVYVNGCSTVGDTGVMVCRARYGSGKVVGMGDSSPMDDGTGDPNDVLYNGWTGDASGNHVPLIMNATIWLAETSVAPANNLQLTTPASVTVCSGNSITMTATGASSYSWQPGGATTASITVQPSSSGLYIVTGTTGNVTKKDTVHVTVDGFSGTTPQLTAGGPLTFCSGGSVNLTATAGSAYLWSNDSTQQSITANASGAYTATITDANGCKATSNSVTVTSDPFSQTHPQLTASGPLSFCTGSSVMLNAPSGYTYHWNNSSTQQSVTATQTGSFYATVTDGNNCHAQTDTASVNVNSSNLAGIQITPTGPRAICSGSSLILTAPAGYTYHWSNGSTQQSISVTQQGSYYLSVSSGACIGVSDTVMVSIDNFASTTPQVNANGPLTFCLGGSVTLTASGGGTYNWNNNTQQQSITVNQAGIFTATVTDANNCTAVSQSVTVTVNSLPIINFAVSPDSVCSNVGALLLNATPAGGIFSGTAVTGSQFSPSTAGSGVFTLTYTYTDSNGCNNNGTARVNVVTCLGIEDLVAAGISIYPNPSAGNFVFRIEGSVMPTDIKVYDEVGKLVANVERPMGDSNLVKVDMKQLPAGIYLAVIERENVVIRKKILKTQ